MNPPDAPDSPDSPESAHSPKSTPKPGAATAKPRAARFKRLVVYSFALVGLAASGLVGYAFYDHYRNGANAIAEDDTIDAVMAANYGRYDEAQKGWLYVGPHNRNYVMRVVQRANLNDGRPGDGLYFVASGTPLDGNTGAVYGVFHLYRQPGSTTLGQEGVMVQDAGDMPLTPERVRFEALSGETWGWVVKEQTGREEADEFMQVTNVVLAPHQGEIAELARFSARTRFIPSMGCDKANEAYAQWLHRNDPDQMTAPAAGVTASAASEAASAAEEGSEDNEGYDETEGDGPMRCEDLSWTYKTDSIDGQAFTPLHITRKGTSEGEKQPDKTWKVMFDPKAFVYLMPESM